MLNTNKKPSKRYCKYGFLTNTEPYHQQLHIYGQTLEERAQDFYTPKEIEEMENEVVNAPNAECAICIEEIKCFVDCLICLDGHKLHKSCLEKYWASTPSKCYYCPITNTMPRMWEKCTNTIDINSCEDNKK
jgi:hypothetical protein